MFTVISTGDIIYLLQPRRYHTMEILKEKYSITDLSQTLGVTDHTLRYYEKEFALSVPKDERGRRYYNTELANVMYHIKSMRNDGLEIKAIRKILISENIISEQPAAASGETSELAIFPIQKQESSSLANMEAFFSEFREQLTSAISSEINTSKEHLCQEMLKSKRELGACIENGMRKMESKMEKHFLEVDMALGNWRQKNKHGLFKLFR